jgi:hypothetical protein
MSRKSPTIIVSSTDHLSDIADAFVALADNPKISKNTVLNLIADKLAKGKLNWGGLKSLPSPVFGKGLDASALLTQERETVAHPSKDTYWIKQSSLGFEIPHKAGSFTVYLSALEIPMLEHAILSSFRFESSDLIFEAYYGKLGVRSKTKHTSSVLEISCTDFLAFIRDQRPNILEHICSTGVGEIVHDAFALAVQSDGQDRLWAAAELFPQVEQRIHEESDAAIDRRIAQACREATWSWISLAASHPERHGALLREERQNITSVIIDYDHLLIHDVMEKMLEREDNARPLSLPETVSEDIYAEGVVTRSVIDLRPGDRVDLEKDEYADPEVFPWSDGNPALQSEFQVVEDVKMETPDCVLVYFEGWDACGFPVDHRVKVDGEQVLPVFILKNCEVTDEPGRFEFLTLTRAGDEHERLIMSPDEARAYSAQLRLEFISPARLMTIRKQSSQAKPFT